VAQSSKNRRGIRLAAKVQFSCWRRVLAYRSFLSQFRRKNKLADLLQASVVVISDVPDHFPGKFGDFLKCIAIEKESCIVLRWSIESASSILPSISVPSAPSMDLS
jgi:hypothetical protein